MKPSEKFSPYRRSAFLSGVPADRRALAERLCDMLEAAFDAKDISVYAGFPIVVRDMEWIAGFAMRSAGPVAYCCSPATLAEMGAELKPYMSGKSCISVKPRRGESIDDVLALVARAFAAASRNGGMISKADRKKRDSTRAKKQAPPSKRAAPAKSEVKTKAKPKAKAEAKTEAKSR